MTSNGWFPKWIIIGFPTLDTWEITSKTPKHINRFDVLCGNSNDAPCSAHCLGHNKYFFCDLRTVAMIHEPIEPSGHHLAGAQNDGRKMSESGGIRSCWRWLWVKITMQLTVDHGIGSPGRVGKTCSCMFCVFLGAGMTKVLFFLKSQYFYPYPYQNGKMAPCSESLWRCFLNRPWDRFWPHRTELPAIEFRLCFEVNVFLGMFFESQTLDFFPRASERRVLPILGVCLSSSHPHIFSSSHLLIFTSSHLHILTSSHLLIFTSSHHLYFLIISIFSPFSHHLHTFTSSHLLIFTFSHLHIFTSFYFTFFFPTKRHETQPVCKSVFV